MYTLASASVLAIALAQHPNGARLADVIDRTLALSVDELAAFGPYNARRQPAVAELTELDRTALLAVLELLQRESPLCHAAPDAVDAALDAVTAAWLGIPTLSERWDAVLSPMPACLPETAYAESLRLLLEEVTRRSREQWHRVAAVHAGHRGRLWWSTRMHRACWAAHDADRLAEVARAQLATARALSLSTARDDPEFQAIAMEVTGSVQALCTGDLLDSSALREAWLAGA